MEQGILGYGRFDSETWPQWPSIYFVDIVFWNVLLPMPEVSISSSVHILLLTLAPIHLIP